MPDQALPWQSSRVADAYDAFFADLPDTDGPVRRLAELAGDGPALELGVGTGRVALPLAARGVAVHGIDLAEPMLEQLRAKPGAERVTTSVGDFSTIDVDGPFALVYAVTGTFFELPDQDAQLRCFRSVADRLVSGGRFALDGLIPDAVAAGEGVRVRDTADGRPMLHLRTFSGATQEMVSQYVVFGPAGTEVVRVRFRYAWPGELDLMARLAGLHLVERTTNWRGRAFGPNSKQHVSIYARD
ncbi:MAG TPA: class I SAM-dependent methyltransferase [Pseudonocardia sp.]|nr:class I SAM-dependent methyltransferase [Pseudonocardia sp.]